MTMTHEATIKLIDVIESASRENCKHTGIKLGCSPPDGYPDPYGVPADGSPCKRPPNGYGSDSWSKCTQCGTKFHHVNGKITEVVPDGDDRS